MNGTAELSITSRTRALSLPALRSTWMLLILMCSDGLALSLAVAISVGCKALVYSPVHVGTYFYLLPFVCVFWAVFAAVGLYSGIALAPPEELRRCSLCSAVVFLFLSIATFSMRGAQSPTEPTLFLAITLSAALIPLLRVLTRFLFGNRAWWGYPAVIFGSWDAGSRIAEFMLRTPHLGLKPTAIIYHEGEPESFATKLPTLAFADFESCPITPGAYAVVTQDGNRNPDELARVTAGFSRILVIPELFTGSSNLQITPKAVGNSLGLEICQRPLLAYNRVSKRCFDFALTVIIAIFVMPLAVLIAALIRLDSPGPMFYHQQRLKGRGGEFRAYKFRTMRVDADQVLAEHLERDPALRAEWERDHKLRNDPRVTRLGGLLRKTSLDELPQLWNVLRGEMSLVGPRPIVQAEVIRYGAGFRFYNQVPGGITGLWQVSGRNSTTYNERVAFDEYYARNWSVWLDLYILIRTVGAVLGRKGAY